MPGLPWLWNCRASWAVKRAAGNLIGMSVSGMRRFFAEGEGRDGNDRARPGVAQQHIHWASLAYRHITQLPWFPDAVEPAMATRVGVKGCNAAGWQQEWREADG